MYSLNAQVPPDVASLAVELSAEVPMARPRSRGDHTLVVKRFDDTNESYARLEARAREVLSGAPACEARVADIGLFEEAVTGTSPVVYLRVESQGVETLHERLIEAFGPVASIEGDAYTPHVTIARGGRLDAARDLASRDIDPIEWVVDEIAFWDAKRSQPVSRISLPA